MMNNVLIFDCEATIHAKGNPFSESNRLMCVGVWFNGSFEYLDIEHSGEPYGDNLLRLRELFSQARLIVGHNVKYDLHWIRRYIPDIQFAPVFDTQLAEFLISNQTFVYPSLKLCAESYNLPPKFMDIEELWDAGINTSDIPRDVLYKRVAGDVEITKELYERQSKILEKQGKSTLFKLQCEDLLVLQEMEFNGMLFDQTESLRLGVVTEDEMKGIYAELHKLVPYDFINWNSNDHLSAILYGGIINYPSTKTVYRTLKSGAISQREVKCYAQQQFPRLITPLRGTETARTIDLTDADIEGLNRTLDEARKARICRHWFVNEAVLKSLPAKGLAKSIISYNLRLAELTKLSTTYYFGLPELVSEMQWGGNLIHGSLNQVVARTGRLSSSNPNLQNFAGVIKPLFKSRYDN